jgi:hypothetical protein
VFADAPKAAEANSAMLSFLLASPSPPEPDEDEELVLDEPIVAQPLGGFEEGMMFLEDRVGKKKKHKKNKK